MSEHPVKDLQCQWMEPPCHDLFSDPEELFRHLCDAHVGRKSQGTLTLKCAWSQCQTTCAKRDHITSHMRVHTPLKPHACTTCNKAFKRPQDLRKHEKIHTEEHHVRHKQSKAITIPSTNKSDANSGSLNESANGVHTSPPPQQISSNPATQQSMMPYMLPYPYSYMTSPEQQAGLAELFLQQQRLNAAAAQLMGLPPHLQQMAALQQAQAQAVQQSPFGAAAFPGGAAAAALMMPGLFQNFGQLPQQQQQQAVAQHLPPPYGGAAVPTHQQHQGQQQQQNGVNGHAEQKGTGLYPSLNDLLGKSQNVQPQARHESTSRASSSAASPGSSANNHHHSVSPHPAHPQANYTNGNTNHFNAQHPSDYAQSTPLQPVVPNSKANGASNRGSKRSFNDEADSLLADLKKKRFDPSDNAMFDHRLDALSSYLFSSDGSLSDSFVSSVPSAVLESTQSPSDGSSHSSSSNYSPRSASGSVRSPLDGTIEISKNDIDDINSLLFSFGQPYDSPRNSDAKDALQWPASAPSINAGLDYNFNTAYQAPQTVDINGHERIPSSNGNGSLYPSLSDLSQTQQHQNTQSKPIKPLPPNRHATQQQQQNNRSHYSSSHNNQNGSYQNNQHGHHGAGSGMPNVSFDYLAPSRTVPTPYISSDHTRDPMMNTVQLLSRAPPPAPMRSVLSSPDIEQRRAKQGVSSLRSTVEEEDVRDSPEPMSEDEQEERRQFHANERARYTLPPMMPHRPEQRGAECHLPSLRSLLNEPLDSASTASPAGSPTLSTTSSSSKRHTPSRQFYPSLASFSQTSSVRDEPSRRPSTSDRLDHVLRGVDRFRLNSLDDYKPEESADAEDDGGAKSESDDDLGPEAVYKRSRLRTRSPTHSDEREHSSSTGSTSDNTRHASVEEPDHEEEEDAEARNAKIVRHRRLAIIRALIARANELYRMNLAAKASHPALVRVKEEELE